MVVWLSSCPRCGRPVYAVGHHALLDPAVVCGCAEDPIETVLLIRCWNTGVAAARGTDIGRQLEELDEPKDDE